MIILQHIRSLWHHEGGSPAVEFAVAAIPTFMLVFGVVEYGLINLVTILAEGSVRDAARFGVTGNDPAEGTRLAEIKKMIDEQTLGLLDMDEATLEIRSYRSFADVDKAESFDDANNNGSYDEGETYNDCNASGSYENDRGSDGAGGSGDVVVYRLSYDWPLLTPFFTDLFAAGGTYPIRVQVAVRNEPWDVNALMAEERDSCE